MDSDVELDPWAPSPPPGEDDLPWEDDEPMESQRHLTQMTLLIDSLADAWRDRDDFFVGGNMFVYFSELQVHAQKKFRGPDVFVVLDTVRRARKSWVAWQEQRLPNVVIELLSPKTEHLDRGEKMEVYARVWRMPEYFLFDVATGALEGYDLDPVRWVYVPKPVDARGDLAVKQMGVSLGVRDHAIHEQAGPWLRWIDRDGSMLLHPRDRAELEKARADESEARARSERDRAEAALRRVSELEAELAKRR